MRMQCHETGSEETNSPHRDSVLLFKPVCHLCVILSEPIPPPVHQRQNHKMRQEKPVGYGTCGMHTLTTVPTEITEHDQNDPNSFIMHTLPTVPTEITELIYMMIHIQVYMYIYTNNVE